MKEILSDKKAQFIPQKGRGFHEIPMVMDDVLLYPLNDTIWRGRTCDLTDKINFGRSKHDGTYQVHRLSSLIQTYPVQPYLEVYSSSPGVIWKAQNVLSHESLE